MIFKVKGINSSGEKVSEKIEATSLAEVKSKLKAKNIIYKSISEESVSFFDNLEFTRKYKIPAKELSSLSRELSMYIRSGITIVSALKVIQSHYEKNKKMKLFLTTLSSHLDEGKDFYTALETQSVVSLPEFFKHTIKVSESGGVLDEVLMELSRFLKEQERINKEIKSAFAYPTFMIVVSLLMIAFMLSFVVPQITGIFENMDQKLPTPTIVVIAMGDFFNHNFTTILGIIFLFTVAFMVLMK